MYQKCFLNYLDEFSGPIDLSICLTEAERKLARAWSVDFKQKKEVFELKYFSNAIRLNSRAFSLKLQTQQIVFHQDKLDFWL